MMNTQKVRLWRANWVSRTGIPGPSKLFEGQKYGEILKQAKDWCRLSDFPDVWTVYIEDTGRIYHEKRGKWFDTQHFPRK